MTNGLAIKVIRDLNVSGLISRNDCDDFNSILNYFFFHPCSKVGEKGSWENSWQIDIMTVGAVHLISAFFLYAIL